MSMIDGLVKYPICEDKYLRKFGQHKRLAPEHVLSDEFGLAAAQVRQSAQDLNSSA
jgi:hypothetical protein